MESRDLLSSMPWSPRCAIVSHILFDLVLTLSQNKSTTAIENVFPEVLRDPILRKVQFSTISRIDDLGQSTYVLSNAYANCA